MGSRTSQYGLDSGTCPSNNDCSYCGENTPSNRTVGVKEPQTILSVHVVCAETEKEAQRQITPVILMYRYLSQGMMDMKIPKPAQAVEELGELPRRQPYEKGSGIPPRFIFGTPEQVHEDLKALSEDLSVNEIIVQDLMTDHQARLHSYELLASEFNLNPRKNG
ncbi:MAG: hypothetical protein WD317_09040 [Balneolaceae bacterium]